MRTTSGYRFDHRYREALVLADGARGVVRLLRADDKELLRRGFERLSEEARYQRFFVGKRMLLDGELRYLTELDQVDHVALVAVRPPTAGLLDEAMAVARAVRLPFEPAVYEVAVTVVDAFQRRGLGTLLFARIVEAIGERGGRRLRFCVLPSNRAMLDFLRRAAPEAELVDADGLVQVDVPLGGRGIRGEAPGDGQVGYSPRD